MMDGYSDRRLVNRWLNNRREGTALIVFAADLQTETGVEVRILEISD